MSPVQQDLVTLVVGIAVIAVIVVVLRAYGIYIPVDPYGQ